MSGPSAPDLRPVETKDDLISYFQGGCKPKSDWRIGTEHEKFSFNTATLEAVPYEGPNGIEALLTGLQERFDWEPLTDNGKTIGLKKSGYGSISLEPGGQFELSGAPLENLHQTCSEVHSHLDEVRSIGAQLGIGMLGLGFTPQGTRDETPWMPKSRYKIMRSYMPKVGKLGLDMMLRSCTIQVNLDFSSEADFVDKLQVGLALQPVATALFASSPFTEGKLNGYKSYRARIWQDTDPDRTGNLPFAFEPGMSFERYVDYALDVPMYFVMRDGQYIDVSGQSFRDFLKGELPGLPGEKPNMGDWADHISTCFPEVRAKTFLEMRGADGGPWASICALPALWVGLLYDEEALSQAKDLIADWSAEERHTLMLEVPKFGQQTPWRGGSLQDLARQVVEIASGGLERRGYLDRNGEDERRLLRTLVERVETGRSPADDLIALYEGDWQGDMSRVFQDYAY
jgi:glutamate--cysteine ligase